MQYLENICSKNIFIVYLKLTHPSCILCGSLITRCLWKLSYTCSSAFHLPSFWSSISLFHRTTEIHLLQWLVTGVGGTSHACRSSFPYPSSLLPLKLLLAVTHGHSAHSCTVKISAFVVHLWLSFCLPEIGQITCPENGIALYVSHCCAFSCLVYLYNPLHGILERQRGYTDDKSHYLSVCIHTSYLELFIQPPGKKTTFEELFQRTHKFWLHFFQLLMYFSAAVYRKTLQKIVHIFCLWTSLPFRCKSARIRLSSTTIPSYHWAIRESPSQCIEYRISSGW